MARTEITMPQLGESVTEGTITRWLKSVGDSVAEDELLFEVSTDKVDSEVPSPAAGVLAEILVNEGDTVDVGAVLCVISDEAGGVAAAPIDREQPAQQQLPADAPTPPEPQAQPAAPPAPAPQAPPAPAPQAPPAPAPVAPAPAAVAATAPTTSGNGRLLSPIVRKLVSEYGLDPAQISGSGSGGRITRNDVMRHVEQNRAAPRPAPTAPAAPARAPAPPTSPAVPAPAGERDERVPFNNIRRRTAEHMVMSKATSPHVLMAIEVDFEGIERVRRAHRDEWKQTEGFSLTYLPFVARAVCDAIRDFPNVNVSVDGTDLIVHHYVNLGIAVDLDLQGLIVPVIRDADTKRLRQLARESRDLAARARSKQLSPDDLMGGTYTISNSGPFGTLLTAPVINQPQVAIMSTDGVKKRPVVVEGPDGDALAIHHTGNIAQVFDHRAFDGAYNAAFLALLKEIIETRDWESELA